MIDPNPKLMESYNRCFPQIKTHKTPLSKALARGDGQAAQDLMGSMETQGMEYNLQERWQITVFKNLDFNDEEFLCLSSEMQSLIYRTANNFNNINLVAHLNTLGKYTIEVPVTRPCILSLRMDIATIHQTLSAYLIKLRQEDRLLTETEFQAFQSNGTWRKKRDFTRILGRDYILQLIEERGLQHIKVPEKKVVINGNKETFSLQISEYGNWELVQMQSDDISIYVQNIQKTNRLVSREEMTELFTIIEAANFTDLWDANFIIAEDGIYFIDTELKSFDHQIPWGKMARLTSFMANEDQEWFKQQIDLKSEDQKCTDQKDFLGFKIAHNFGKGAKQSTQEKLAKGIIDPAAISFAVMCKECVKQHKLVGFKGGFRLFSFPMQDLLKQRESRLQI